MNYKIILFISILFLTACQNTTTKKTLPSTDPATKDIIEKTSKDNVLEKKDESSKGFITDQKYRNVGFALIYENDIKKINGQNKAMYSPILNYEGGILDDLIVYYLGNKSFRIVSNCATREKNLSWLSKIAEPFDVGIDFKSDYSILALQGPNSHKFIKSHIEKDISKFSVHNTDDVMIASTGYTGELGYEIICDQEKGIKFWNEFVSNDVQPIGLAARDTLRLEAGLNLYGTDMDQTNTPYDSNIGWTIDFNDKDRDFIGKKALEEKKDSKKILKGFYTEERGVLRGGAEVIFEGGSGVVTSGTWSPTFKKNIGFCRVDKNCGEIGSAVLRDKKITLKFSNTNFLESLK